MGRPSKYPPEFRREAVQLVLTAQRPVAEVARSLGATESSLHDWLKAERDASARAADPDGLSESERLEWRGRQNRYPGRLNFIRPLLPCP